MRNDCLSANVFPMLQRDYLIFYSKSAQKESTRTLSFLRIFHKIQRSTVQDLANAAFNKALAYGGRGLDKVKERNTQMSVVLARRKTEREARFRSVCSNARVCQHFLAVLTLLGWLCNCGDCACTAHFLYLITQHRKTTQYHSFLRSLLDMFWQKTDTISSAVA